MLIISKLYDNMSSIRLTIFLCILLAAVSLIGTLVPQNLTHAEYDGMYGHNMARVVLALNVYDIYHSPAFLVLLTLLAGNLTACSARRFPRVLRSMRRGCRVPADLNFTGWRCQGTIALTSSPGDSGGGFERVLSKVLGRGVKKMVSDPKKQVFFIERNRVARLGPYLAHVSILLILVGGLVGGLLGFKGSLTLAEGEEASSIWSRGAHETIPFGFRIRCNQFTVDHFPDGTPKEYRSEVTLLDEKGEEILEQRIRVNHPLSYQGITFYQATYGNLAKITLGVEDRESGEKVSIQTGLNEPFLLPGEHDLRGVVVSLEENMRIPDQMVRQSAFSRGNLGAGVRISIFSEEKGMSQPFWILKEFPQMEARRQGSHGFTLEAFRSVPFTGLQVAHDPGTPMVWTGCILLVVGFMVSFLLDHEILWVVREEQEENRVVVRMAGRAVRHPAVYEGRFEKKKEKLRRALAPRMTST